MKQINRMRLFRFAALLAVFGILCSCNDWTEMESVDSEVKKPWEQDPALWAQYTAALRAYKNSEHFIVYARMENSPEKASSEKDFMRGLPDSVDMVSLTNADNFSKYDSEDMPVMRQKGTKVLYQVDYAGRAEELSDAAKLGAYLDQAIASVKLNGLDGYSFTGTPDLNDPAVAEAAALLVAKLSADESKLLVFEGNPLFVAEADRAKVDYFVLDTDNTGNVTDVKMQVINALKYVGIPAEKLLLAAEAGSSLYDEEMVEHAAITEMSNRVVPFGPVGGLAVYKISDDYYYSDMNYKLVREAIQSLNPSK